MEKRKLYSIFAVTLLFLIFSSYFLFKTKSYTVLKIDTPQKIYVDLNKNGVADDKEGLALLNNFQIILRDNIEDDCWDSLKLDDYTKFSFMYLTEKFVNDLLVDKKVCLKVINDQKELFLSNESYTDIMVKSGLLFKEGMPVNKNAYKKRLEQIKKNEYKLYNLKSNKYHLLTCKFGRQAHNYIFVSKYQIPKGAIKCKYCLDDNSSKTNKTDKKKKKNSCPNLSFTYGCIKVFFTDYTNHLIPNRFGNTQICKELVNQINLAKESIDIAIYGYDRVPKIENALKNAQKRGVKIRIVYDTDENGNNIYAHTKDFVKMFPDSVSDKAPAGYKNSHLYTNSIMHNKFYIFDKSRVITGSANLSYTDLSDYNANCVILINSKQIADIYEKEFEQMFSSRFHTLKTKIYSKSNIKLGDSILSVYFSPADNIIQTAIIPLINSAKKYIYMPVFLITDNKMAQALINARSRGVDVKIIVDATNAKNSYSKHRLLRAHGIEVKTENYAGKMHSKSIIIDDKYTVIGSMNFSKSGERKNDENVIVIRNPRLAIFYKKYFVYLWSKISNFWLTHDVSAESVYSMGSCSDGIDNDYDGLVDKADDGCKIKK